MLGANNPELGDLLQGKTMAPSLKDDALVTTWAMAEREQANEEARLKKQKESGVISKSIQEIDSPPAEPDNTNG